MVAVNFSTNFTFNASNMTIVQKWTNMSTPSDFVSPVTDWWIGEVGMWFWFFMFFVTVGIVYIKSESIYPTAATIIILAAVMAWKLPPPVQTFAYLFLVAAVVAILFKAIFWRSTT